MPANSETDMSADEVVVLLKEALLQKIRDGKGSSYRQKLVIGISKLKGRLDLLKELIKCYKKGTLEELHVINFFLGKSIESPKKSGKIETIEESFDIFAKDWSLVSDLIFIELLKNVSIHQKEEYFRVLLEQDSVKSNSLLLKLIDFCYKEIKLVQEFYTNLVLMIGTEEALDLITRDISNLKTYEKTNIKGVVDSVKESLRLFEELEQLIAVPNSELRIEQILESNRLGNLVAKKMIKIIFF